MSDIVRLNHGLIGDRIFHINEVANGLACGCRCPNCGARLIARQGTIRAWSFAHHQTDECDLQTAGETALHLAAKQILSEGGKFTIPGATAKVQMEDKWEMTHTKSDSQPERVVDLIDPRVEVSIEGFRPDVVVSASGHQLAIEVRVTHKVDRSKRQRFRTSQIPCIEIDLHDVYRNIEMPKLRELIFSSTARKSWVYNRWIEHRKRQLAEDLQKYIEEHEAETEKALNQKKVEFLTSTGLQHNIGVCVFCGISTEDWWCRDSSTGRCRCNNCLRQGFADHPEFQ